GARPGRVRQPADLERAWRRLAAARYVDHGGRTLCAARQPPDAGRARAVPALERGRAAAARERARGAVPGRVRVGRGAEVDLDARRPPPAPDPAGTAGRARSGGDRRALHAARLLPPEPAEHLHRPAHRVDDRCGARARTRAGRAPAVGAYFAPSAPTTGPPASAGISTAPPVTLVRRAVSCSAGS